MYWYYIQILGTLLLFANKWLVLIRIFFIGFMANQPFKVIKWWFGSVGFMAYQPL